MGFGPPEVLGILGLLRYAESESVDGPVVFGLEVLTIPNPTTVPGGPLGLFPPASLSVSDWAVKYVPVPDVAPILAKLG
jgi:hypothetical protein